MEVSAGFVTKWRYSTYCTFARGMGWLSFVPLLDADRFLLVGGDKCALGIIRHDKVPSYNIEDHEGDLYHVSTVRESPATLIPGHNTVAVPLHGGCFVSLRQHEYFI